MKYVVSVSKTYKHRGFRRHRESTSKYWHIYYFDESWNFFCEQVSSIKALYYKKNLYHKLKRACPNCLSVFYTLVKNKSAKIECPNCYEKL